MKEEEIQQLFTIIEESSEKDNLITTADILNYVGIDLVGDGQVSNLPLYRKQVQEPSKVDPTKMITYYKYRSCDCSACACAQAAETEGYEAYVVDGIHQTEQLLRYKTNTAWVEAFGEELGDEKITYEEFREYLLKPFPS